jgi:PAS domain
MFSAARAARCFEECPPGPGGQRLARYWLSLWRGDALPMRADFRPKEIIDLLPSICLFDVVPGESVYCRLAGTFIVQGAGQDLTGRDWLAMTHPDERATRLARFSDIARGAIGRGLRMAKRVSGEPQACEEIMLPFADVAADGARQVLTYIAWRPEVYDPTRTGVAHTGGLLSDFRLTPLVPTADI